MAIFHCYEHCYVSSPEGTDCLKDRCHSSGTMTWGKIFELRCDLADAFHKNLPEPGIMAFIKGMIQHLMAQDFRVSELI